MVSLNIDCWPVIDNITILTSSLTNIDYLSTINHDYHIEYRDYHWSLVNIDYHWLLIIQESHGNGKLVMVNCSLGRDVGSQAHFPGFFLGAAIRPGKGVSITSWSKKGIERPQDFPSFYGPLSITRWSTMIKIINMAIDQSSIHDNFSEPPSTNFRISPVYPSNGQPWNCSNGCPQVVADSHFDFVGTVSQGGPVANLPGW